MFNWVLNAALNCVYLSKVMDLILGKFSFVHLKFHGFFEIFLGYKAIPFYTRWSETNLTYLFPFASARSFHQYWKLLFKTFNQIKQTEFLSRAIVKTL